MVTSPGTAETEVKTAPKRRQRNGRVLTDVLLIPIAIGAFRRWGYGIGLLVHAATTIVTARLIIGPWGLISGEPQHLYLAAMPILGAFAALYLLRDLDFFSLDEWRAGAGRRVQPENETVAYAPLATAASRAARRALPLCCLLNRNG